MNFAAGARFRQQACRSRSPRLKEESSCECGSKAMRKISKDDLRDALASILEVRESSLGFEVQLPVVYPNGEMVTVVVTVEGGEYIVHDAGFGSMILNSAGMNLTANLEKKLFSIAQNYGCEFLNGRMSRRCDAESLAIAITIVANASRSIGDQILYRSAEPMIDFRRQAIEKIRAAIGGKRLRENEEVFGDSGYAYRVSAVILDHGQDRAVGYVEPIKDHDAATKKFREFWDISKSERSKDIARLSFYDDLRNWKPSDLILLQKVSNVVRLSDSDARMKEFAHA